SDQELPPPPRRWRPEVPADLEAICLKCLEKEPARRYASAEQLADELGRYLRGRCWRTRAGWGVGSVFGAGAGATRRWRRPGGRVPDLPGARRRLVRDPQHRRRGTAQRRAGGFTGGEREGGSRGARPRVEPVRIRPGHGRVAVDGAQPGNRLTGR